MVISGPVFILSHIVWQRLMKQINILGVNVYDTKIKKLGIKVVIRITFG
jgi:hypothetical protein